MWASRIASIDRPDWCVLDLDPKDAPFADVLRVAKATHALCESIGLPSFIKTSGSSGLHVLIPLGRQCGYDEARVLGELLARVVVAELPDIATITRQVSRRGGKVYVDYLQNGAGRLLVAPFCVRPLPGAPVSTPLKWSEVNDVARHPELHHQDGAAAHAEAENRSARAMSCGSLPTSVGRSSCCRTRL